MNKLSTIEAKVDSYNFGWPRRYLSLFVNGWRLDELVSQATDGEYRGMLPAWLDIYPNHPDEPDHSQYQEIREAMMSRFDPEGEESRIVPLLITLDCKWAYRPLLVAEVVPGPETVAWNRIGVDLLAATASDSKDGIRYWRKIGPNDPYPKGCVNSRGIGDLVHWLPAPDGSSESWNLVFDRDQYLKCLAAFKKTWNTASEQAGDLSRPAWISELLRRLRAWVERF